MMVGRNFSVADYRFGFNSKEKDDEVNGSGTTYNYGFRIYSSRLSRFLSIDPLFQAYPWYTPYQFAGNNSIWAIDLDGLEELIMVRHQYADGHIGNWTEFKPGPGPMLTLKTRYEQDNKYGNFAFSREEKIGETTLEMKKMEPIHPTQIDLPANSQEIQLRKAPEMIPVPQKSNKQKIVSSADLSTSSMRAAFDQKKTFTLNAQFPQNSNAPIIDSKLQGEIDELGRMLKADKSLKINLEGNYKSGSTGLLHTIAGNENVPVGNQELTRSQLALQRADSIKKAIVDTFNIDPERITTSVGNKDEKSVVAQPTK